jgi:hypothetical protein
MRIQKVMRALRIALALVAVSAASVVRADFIATTELLGANETPPTGSLAAGTASVFFNAAADTLTYQVEFAGLEAPATMAHIHFGDPGVAGPVLFAFTNQGPPAATSGAFMGILTAADLHPDPGAGITTFAQAVAAIETGHTYANLHSGVFPGGEIRGQLQAISGAVPEPASVVMFATGTLASWVCWWYRRRRSGGCGTSGAGPALRTWTETLGRETSPNPVTA